MPVQSESVNLPELLQCERIVLFPPHVSRRLHIQTLEIDLLPVCYFPILSVPLLFLIFCFSLSDLLYTIMADALKDSYQLRPIADHEVDELLTEIDNCIQHVEQLISPISLELDKFPNYDDILIELEQLRNLLENY